MSTVHFPPESAARGEVPTRPEALLRNGKKRIGHNDRLVIDAASEAWEERGAVGIMEAWPGCFRIVGAGGDVFVEASTATDLLPWLRDLLAAMDQISQES